VKIFFKGYFFALFIFITILPSRLYANHILGADITWKQISADTFLFTAAVYRSCAEMKLANSPFSYFGTCAGYTAPKTILGSMCCTMDVTPGNNGGCDQCNDPTCTYPYGTQLINEEVKIVFPAGCCDWFVSWGQNYRDGSINTIPGGQPFYVEAEINTCLNRRDNSPTFNTPANNIFCVNQCNMMDNSAKDIDSTSKIKPDSLVYKLVSPLQGHDKPVTYDKNYSYLNPMIVWHDSVPCVGFNLDNQTGMLQFQPRVQGISVMAIEVDEWRQDANGIYQKIGSIIRDIEFYVASSCPPTNTLPVIPGINGGNSYSDHICRGQQQLCFQIRAFDLNGDTVKMSWNQPSYMKGAVFSNISGTAKWPTYNFCWSPNDSLERLQPYTFTVTARSTKMPFDSISQTFSIYVDPPPKAKHSATNSTCGIVNFQASADSSPVPIATYQWAGQGNDGSYMSINGPSSSYQYYQKGWYRYSLLVRTSNSCLTNYSDSVYVTPTLQISLPQDTIVCAKSPSINLSPVVTLGKGPFKYAWNTGETTLTKTALITKDTSFIVTVTDAAGCSVPDSAYILFQNPPPPKPASVVYKCANAPILLNPKDIGSQVVWTAIIGSKTIPNYSYSNPLSISDSGIYVATSANSTICPGIDSFIVQALHDTVVYFQRNLCYGIGYNYEFPGGGLVWIDSGANNNWVSVPNPINNPTLIKIPATDYRGYKIKTTQSFVSHGIFCNDTVIYNYTVDSLNPHLLIKSIPELCIYDHPLNLNAFVNPIYKYGTWSYTANPSAIVDSILYPSLMGVTSNSTNLGIVEYNVRYNTCQVEASQRIIVWPKVSAGPDTTIWKICGKYILNNQNVTPRYGGKWTVMPGTPASCLEYKGDTVLFDPDSVSGNGKYGFVYTYNNKIDTTAACSGADTMFITLTGKPVISISPIGNLCDDANSYPISATPPGGHFEFADYTNLKALSGNNIIPVIAGIGYHRLRYVIATVYGSAACTDTAGVGFNVVKPPDPEFITEDGNWQYCASHGPVKLIPNTPGGTFIGATFIRRDTAYFDPSKQGADTTFAESKITYYLPYNNGACSEVYSQNISTIPNASLKILSDSSQCGNNGSFSIQAAAANCYGYFWSSPDANGQDGGTFYNDTKSGNSLSVNYIPGAAQLKKNYFIIYLEGWGASGCDTVRTSLKIRIKQGPQPEFTSKPLQGCDPVTVHFKNISFDSSSTIISYEWNFGDGSPVSNDTNPVHVFHDDNADSLSFYFVTLTATSKDGCSNTFGANKIAVSVYADPVPIISAVPTFTTLDKPRIRFRLSPQSKWIDPNDTTNIYLWHFLPQGLDTGGYSTLPDPEHVYKDTGKFTVVLKLTVDDQFNCSGTDSAFAIVDIHPAFAIFIPNVFAPGSKIIQNKTFKPVISSYTNFKMTISSRWGNMVFNTTDPDKGWDGRILGQMAPSDVYVYNIEVSDLYGRVYKYNGNVTMLR